MKKTSLSKFSLIALLIVMPSKSHSQWVHVNGPSGETLVLATKGDSIFAGTDGGGVLYSLDDGLDWYNSALDSGYMYSIAYDGNSIFASSGIGTYLSTNNGTSWHSALGQTANAFAFFDNKVFAATESGIYISTNEGKGWYSSDSGITKSTDVSSITVCDTSIVIGSYGGMTPEHSWFVVLRSTDKGISWNLPDTAFTADYINVVTTHGQNIFAGTNHSGIYRSTNEGRTWSLASTGLTSLAVNCFAVSGTAVFAATESGVFLSTNEGGQWWQTNSGLSDTSVASLVVSGKYLLASTQSHGVWRRLLSEMVTSVKELNDIIPNKFSLLQNYPNPFNPKTVISYQLPVNALVTLKVFDELGQLVRILVNENQTSGTHSVPFNAGSLSSGVYFYRLEAGNFVQTKKLVVLK